MKQKRRTVWLYLDGKKHCDVVLWALGANVSVSDAKVMLSDMYKNLTVEFKVI